MGRVQPLISRQGGYRDWDTVEGLGAPCFSWHVCDILFMETENIFTQILSHCVIYIRIIPGSAEPHIIRLGKRYWPKEEILLM